MSEGEVRVFAAPPPLRKGKRRGRPRVEIFGEDGPEIAAEQFSGATKVGSAEKPAPKRGSRKAGGDS